MNINTAHTPPTRQTRQGPAPVLLSSVKIGNPTLDSGRKFSTVGAINV